jgi:hypothetical protein
MSYEISFIPNIKGIALVLIVTIILAIIKVTGVLNIGWITVFAPLILITILLYSIYLILQYVASNTED